MHETPQLVLSDLDDFRREATAFLDDAVPRRTIDHGSSRADTRIALFEGSTAEDVDAARTWRRQLFDAGFGWITGPVERGGRGLTRRFEAAFRELERDYHTPSQQPLGIGLGMVAPTLHQLGSPAAVERWLIALLRGDHVGCQLFSEPGAGSDLGAIATRASRTDAGWVVSGQKVWTSGAQFADLGLLLARTSEAPRRQNLTAFIVDMHSPGVTVRPLRQMTGSADFSEVFLDEVVVADDCRLGEVGGGWTVAMATLAHERSTIGDTSGGGRGLFRLERVVAALRDLGVADDPGVRQAYAHLHAGVVAAKQMQRRATTTGEGGRPGPEASLAKLALIGNLAALSDLMTLALGPRLLADTGDPGTFVWTEYVLGVPGFRLAGGTDEIQRNVIAERVLDLPREPDLVTRAVRSS